MDNPYAQQIQEARKALNATKWWQFIKREDAAAEFKRVLLLGAWWEIDHRD